MNRRTVDRLAQLHKALADASRLRILNLLSNLGELCVCDVEAALDYSQSKASRHLNILKQVGLVTDRRDGTWSYYRLVEDLEPAARSALAMAREVMGTDARLVDEVARARARRRSPGCA